MTIVKFLMNFGIYQKGEVAGFEDISATSMINKGYAVLFQEKPIEVIEEEPESVKQVINTKNKRK